MATQVESIKWVPGTNFIVDGFAFQSPRCRHYFLTHFHSDHTVGLTKGFKAGVIYASPVTTRLLIHDLGLRPQVVQPLQVGAPVVIEGVRVTPLDANHCPGSVMFLFEVPLKQPQPQQQPQPHAVKAAAADCMLRVPCLVHCCPTDRPASPASGPDGCGPGGGGGGSAEPSAPAADRGSPCPAAADKAKCEQLAALAQRRLLDAAVCCGLASVDPTAEGASGPCREGDGLGDTVCGRAAAGREGAAASHTILHTGDCRWQPWMAHQPGLAGVRVETLFLDTTYAAPKHSLPPQSEAIDMMVKAMREALAEEPATVFLVAAYHIGKERAFLGAAQQLGAKVWCSASKRALLRLLDLPAEHLELLVEDPREAAVHVTGWGLRPEDLQAYLDEYPGVWKRAVGIRPTGWTLRRSGGVSVRREGNVAVVGVPYSEHSSWTDLCSAVAQLRPRRLVPTVNAATPAARRALVDRFAHLMDLREDRSRLDVYLSRGGKSGTCGTQHLALLTPAPGLASVPTTPDSGPVAGQPHTATAGRSDSGRVDLATVDVAEQARILADLEERNSQRAASQAAAGDGRPAKRKAQRVDGTAGLAGSSGRKRQRTQEASPAPARLSRGAALDDMKPATQLLSQAVGPAVSGAGAAGSRPVAPHAGRSGDSRGRGRSSTGAICFVDLTVGDEDDGCGCEARDRAASAACGGSVAVSRAPGLSGAGWQQAALDAVAVVGAGGPHPVKVRAAGAPWQPQAVSPGLQSTIRRFFAPVHRAVAAVVG